jgi:hypothetical protein
MESAVTAIIDSPELWARAKLRTLNLYVLYEPRGVPTPNETAEHMALDVLKECYSLLPLEPTYIAFSVIGGIFIVYRSSTLKGHVGLECLNNGHLFMLWFDVYGEPHSREIRHNNTNELKDALDIIAALQEN